MKTIDGSYVVISQSDNQKTGIGAAERVALTRSLAALVVSLIVFLIVVGAIVISENPWAIWNEFMRFGGYVAFVGVLLVLAVMLAVSIRAARRG